MTVIYIHFLFDNYGLYENAPVWPPLPLPLLLLLLLLLRVADDDDTRSDEGTVCCHIIGSLETMHG